MSVTLINGDSRAALADLPSGSVHCCVTSPPYFQLRDYEMDGQIGLESSPDAYIAELVAVFREVRRVLRNDGTLWVNIGDSYASKPNGSIGATTLQGSVSPHAEVRRAHAKRSKGLPGGLKHKDLIGIPWLLAFALRADGWFLRQDIIWQKTNAMPESVTDRCTKSHEYLFLLSKSDRYYFDAEAIAEPVAGDPDAVKNRWDRSDYLVPGQKPQKRISRSGNLIRKPGSARGCPEGSGSNVCGSIPWEGSTRNKRSVWAVAVSPFKGAHFATFPPELIEPAILAGCPPGGVVLDPFMGAGTTGLTAARLRRDAIGVELNPAYVAMATARLRARLVEVRGGVVLPPVGMALFDAAGAA